MRLSSVTTAVCVSLLSAACAVGCWYRADLLRSEANWLMERGKAQASEYAQSFNDALATQQLETFAKRRAVMERAQLWQRGQEVGVLFAVAAAACAWMLSLLRRLNGELDDASEELETAKAAEPVSVRAAVRPSRS
ncbi:hypothetical protein [Vitiosangium sp. GDMCC 1.1324]|uniref:hypothetical protein n=1 Tax=Vitiosangium sp. (strain GDMCC 1.1324) TaxID=2138576 RepID=UPI000D3C845A|nr:hypothetical protein [Vitiosangium sp. GDMCC 1.1324]PTL78250.1 hypothetical protein DAT35_40050 [Vitiosangium sp. GDMCC 1.1324]